MPLGCMCAAAVVKKFLPIPVEAARSRSGRPRHRVLTAVCSSGNSSTSWSFHEPSRGAIEKNAS